MLSRPRQTYFGDCPRPRGQRLPMCAASCRGTAAKVRHRKWRCVEQRFAVAYGTGSVNRRFPDSGGELTLFFAGRAWLSLWTAAIGTGVLNMAIHRSRTPSIGLRKSSEIWPVIGTQIRACERPNGLCCASGNTMTPSIALRSCVRQLSAVALARVMPGLLNPARDFEEVQTKRFNPLNKGGNAELPL